MHAIGALWHTLIRVSLLASVFTGTLAQFFHRRAQPGRGCTHQAECSEAWKNCSSSSLNATERLRPSRQP